jgi:hypothetical protein
MDLAELQKKAIDTCRAHAEATLEGTYQVEALEPTLEWDPLDLRTVFEQPMTVWRACSAFEVLLDEADRPVGYVDHDKWTECAWRDLPEQEAVSLVRATGLVPGSFELTGRARGERECLELTFEELAARPPRRIRVRVNPSRRCVISIVPEEEPAP